MGVAGFYGFWPELTKVSELKPMSQIIADNLNHFENRMQREWDYRGLWLNWRAVAALAQAIK